MSWMQKWKTGQVPEKGQQRNTPRTMSSSEEITWLRENVLKKGTEEQPVVRGRRGAPR